MLISAEYSVSGIRSYFSCSKTPKLGKITALNFSDSSKTSQNGREWVIRFVSLPNSFTCNRDKSIMLQRNKSEA